MPEPTTFQITVTPYGPLESDENPAAYLQRCGEDLLTEYGYHYTLMGGADPEQPSSRIHQLQISISDNHAPGGVRLVVVKAPDLVVDVGGAIEAMTEAQYETKYGGA